MIRFYFKIAFRNFQNNQLIQGGSLLSVVLGVLCISLLFSYVRNEFTMNSFHKKNKDIFLMMVQPSPGSDWEAIDASQFFRLDYKNYPELEKSSSLVKYNKETFKIIKDNHSYFPEVLIADSNFFEIFDFKLKSGDFKTVLRNQNSAIITEKYAKHLFGTRNPIGQTILISQTNKEYTINGVAENVPTNSSITFDFILSLNRQEVSKTSVQVILARQNFDKKAFINKIDTICKFHPQFKEAKLGLIPLNETYFSKRTNDQYCELFSRMGDKKVCLILIFICCAVLLIIIFNFTNLQVISINSALKSIGIHKINGACKKHLISKKCIEFLIFTLASIPIISLIYFLSLPFFNQLTNGILAPTIKEVILLNTTIISIIIVMGAIYPFIIIWGVPATNAIKSYLISPKYMKGQKLILTFQYTLAIVLLISGIVITRQLYMMLNRDLGFTSSPILKVKFFEESEMNIPYSEYRVIDSIKQSKFQFVNQELALSPLIVSFAQGYSPLESFSMPSKLSNGNDEFSDKNWLAVSPSYEDVFGLKILNGRFFDPKLDVCRGRKIVINEAAKKYWNIDQLEEAFIQNQYWNSGDEEYEIIGVVKDFNYSHLSATPQPLIMTYLSDISSDYFIRLNKHNIKEGIDFVGTIFEKVNTDQNFTYQFLEDEIHSLYQKEKQLSEIYIISSLIALFISSIGLFTIALYETQRLTKEIGIRRVNGARTGEVMSMLNRDFLKWVAIAFLLACPIAWYAMHKWLENFAYKTELSWWIFAAAGVIAIVIALVTVSWQSWRAASRNPVESLRYE